MAFHTMIEVATSLREHPGIAAAFGTGELSLHQTKVLGDIAEPETEGELVELAHGLSATQLSRFASLYKGALKTEEDSSVRARVLRTFHRSDGSMGITGSVPSYEGARFERALRA